MRKDTLYVGLDTDKKQIDVAVAEALPKGEVRYWGQVANTPASVDRLVKKLDKVAANWSCVTKPGRAAMACIAT